MAGVDETRGNERIPTAVNVQYEVHESMKSSFPFATQKLSSTLTDISASGCAIMTNVFIPKNVLLNLEIEGGTFYPDDPKKVIQVTGRVCNSRNISKDTYRLGVFFEKIAKEDKDAINHFVDGFERRKEKRISFGTDAPPSQGL